MKITELLKPGRYYHIYNCGINGEDLFRMKEDYQRFLNLYEKYILPVCETYAWVLMKNHFHLMVKVKENIIYKYSIKDVSFDKERFNEVKWETVDLSLLSADRPSTLPGLKVEITCQRAKHLTALKPQPHLHFSHLFNAYAKYYNRKYKRHGNFFERPFKRKKIDNKKYFKTMVLYIHQNPVHHGFCSHPVEYGWSSYLTCISIKPTELYRKEVIGWFDNVGNFKISHDHIIHFKEFEEYLGL
jgi:REP element-mobilizing transposase RayT